MNTFTTAALFQPFARSPSDSIEAQRRVPANAATPVRRPEDAKLARIPPAARSRLTVRARRLLRADY